MENLSLLLFISVIVPISFMLFICKDKTRLFLIFFMIGIFEALFCGELNTIVINALSSSTNFSLTNITPMIEELCKAFPILVYAFVKTPSRQDLLELSVAVGVGFALLENAFVFANNPYEITLTVAIMRAFGSGVMHAVCTFAVGFGMSYIHIHKKLFYSGTMALLNLAFIVHSAYNQLVLNNHIYLGFLLPVSIAVALIIKLKRTKHIELNTSFQFLKKN